LRPCKSWYRVPAWPRVASSFDIARSTASFLEPSPSTAAFSLRCSSGQSVLKQMSSISAFQLQMPSLLASGANSSRVSDATLLLLLERQRRDGPQVVHPVGQLNQHHAGDPTSKETPSRSPLRLRLAHGPSALLHALRLRSTPGPACCRAAAGSS